MNHLSWNCQGINNSLTFQKLCEYTRTIQPSLLFLAETLDSSVTMHNLCSYLVIMIALLSHVKEERRAMPDVAST